MPDFGTSLKIVGLIFKNLRRNLLRTSLTSLGTMVLVFVVTIVWSVLDFLNDAMSEKASNLKAIVTERWQIPSQMPYRYVTALSRGAARQPDDVIPVDFMSWGFIGGSIDATNRSFENGVFFIAMEPSKVSTMMDELDEMPAARKADLELALRRMETERSAAIVGTERLKALKKQVGDRFTVHALNYRDIKFEVEVAATFPPGTRYDQTAIMSREYLNALLDQYQREHNGKEHPMANRSLNLVWLRVPNRQAFSRVAEQIMSSPDFSAPAVKCETQSSGVSSFLEAYRDLIWGMKWFFAPAVLATLSLIIANAISISVRERQSEFAVLKVIGFRPAHVLLLVIGEAVVIGALSGGMSAALTYFIINDVKGGLKFPIAFFSAFFIPPAALWWGFTVGLVTALFGSVVPAWSARSVRVADVFAKVA